MLCISMYFVFFCFYFFFQAEDGIRDLVRSRGLGDVYKRQVLDQVRILNRDFRRTNADTVNIVPAFQGMAADIEVEFRLPSIDPVSYTHLTLPTSDLV